MKVVVRLVSGNRVSIANVNDWSITDRGVHVAHAVGVVFIPSARIDYVEEQRDV